MNRKPGRKNKKTAPRNGKGNITCGAYGGELADGTSCGHEAGWGTDSPGKGRCRYHTLSAEKALARDKEQFLYHYENGLQSLTAAANLLGTTLLQIWRWRQEDPAFDVAVEKAKARRQHMQIALVEDTLFRRCVTDVGSGYERIQFLQRRAPDEWKEETHTKNEVTGPGGRPLIPLEHIRALLKGESE